IGHRLRPVVGELGETEPSVPAVVRQPDRAFRPVNSSHSGGARHVNEGGPELKPGVQAALSPGGAGQEQEGSGDAGSRGEGGIAGKLGEDAVEGLRSGVVFEEEVQRAAVLRPPAVRIWAHMLAPLNGAAGLGPPRLQATPSRPAGGAVQAGEDFVDADGVGEALTVGDRQGAVAAIAEVRQAYAVLGGQDGGAGLAEYVVPGR